MSGTLFICDRFPPLARDPASQQRTGSRTPTGYFLVELKYCPWTKPPVSPNQNWSRSLLLHSASLICNTDPLLFCMLYTSLHSPPALIRCVPMTRKLVARPPRWRKHSLTIGAPTTWSSGVPTTLASAKARSSSYGEASTSPLKKRGRVRWQSPLFSLRQMVSQLIKN